MRRKSNPRPRNEAKKPASNAGTGKRRGSMFMVLSEQMSLAELHLAAQPDEAAERAATQPEASDHAAEP